MENSNPDKIEANLNFGMCNATAKQQQVVIQPQILPNLLDHQQRNQVDLMDQYEQTQKKDGDSNNKDPVITELVIGALLGTVDGKQIDISNSFRMTLKAYPQKNPESNKKTVEFVFDTDYMKKMLQFHRKVNDMESLLGVYISQKHLNQEAMAIFSYVKDLFAAKTVSSKLAAPLVLLFDPELGNNKLEIKVLNIHSVFMDQTPIFNELPYKFNIENIDETGLDVLFYGQDHFDTMTICDERMKINQETIRESLDNQQILSNREVMLKNLQNLITGLTECEQYIEQVADGKIVGDAQIGMMMNKCMGQFNSDDMLLLEQLIKTNFQDAMLSHSLTKLQMSQVHLTEKINSIFSASLNRYILHQNQRFQNYQDRQTTESEKPVKKGVKKQ